jgi:quercetin dioxygenase-like cupin family protein
MTLEEFRAQLQLEQFGEPATVARDSAYSLDEHAHPFEAFALITQGEITLEVDGARARYGVGDTFRLPPGKPHHEWAGEQGVQYLVGRKEAKA